MLREPQHELRIQNRHGTLTVRPEPVEGLRESFVGPRMTVVDFVAPTATAKEVDSETRDRLSNF